MCLSQLGTLHARRDELGWIARPVAPNILLAGLPATSV